MGTGTVNRLGECGQAIVVAPAGRWPRQSKGRGQQHLGCSPLSLLLCPWADSSAGIHSHPQTVSQKANCPLEATHCGPRKLPSLRSQQQTQSPMPLTAGPPSTSSLFLQRCWPRCQCHCQPMRLYPIYFHGDVKMHGIDGQWGGDGIIGCEGGLGGFGLSERGKDVKRNPLGILDSTGGHPNALHSAQMKT